MPLFIPFLFGGVALLLGGAGVKKGIDGVDDLREAERIGRQAHQGHRWAVGEVEVARDGVQERATAYGAFKLQTRQQTFARLLWVLESLERRGGLERAEFLREIALTHDQIERFEATQIEAQHVAAGFVRAGLGGAAAASAAYGLAGSIGVASTGAAIGGLSGAAATSASLAWLGGGALAAGGFGMAGGMVVLGGVIAGPALALGGFMIASRGEKALTEAAKYSAQVERAVADLETVKVFLGKVGRRIVEMHDVVRGLRSRLDESLTALEARLGTWSLEKAADREQLRAAMQLAGALSEMIRTPVVSVTGGLTLESAAVVARSGELSA